MQDVAYRHGAPVHVVARQELVRIEHLATGNDWKLLEEKNISLMDHEHDAYKEAKYRNEENSPAPHMEK